MMLALAVLLQGCGAQIEPPPEEIVGHWWTNAASHRDRTLEIRNDSILFGTGQYSPVARYPVIGVERSESEEKEPVFIVHYQEDDGSPSELELVYLPGARPRLRFANRTEIWKRGKRKIFND